MLIQAVTDAPEEVQFGVLHCEDFTALSIFRIDEVKAGPESGFICEVQIHNPVTPKEVTVGKAAA